jgi:hypothetical protein
VNGPYRELPVRPAPSSCEICGGETDQERCPGCSAACLAIEGLRPALELPVVLVALNWALGDSPAGAGFVLVDRWRRLAQCSCRLAGALSARAVASMARTRAELWAPGTHVAVGRDEMEQALAESLVRTPAREDRAICQRFRRAFDRAMRYAEVPT